jgi:hypothetical protein
MNMKVSRSKYAIDGVRARAWLPAPVDPTPAGRLERQSQTRAPTVGVVGVANPSVESVEDSRMYITIPQLQIYDRVLNWAGTARDEGWAIHPPPRSRHAHTAPFLSVGDDGRSYIQASYGNQIVDPGDYVAELCVRGRHTAATTAQIEFTFASRSLKIRLVPRNRALTTKEPVT